MTLSERIAEVRKAREPKVQIERVIRDVVKDAKVVIAIAESNDGGLLVHRAIEAQSNG